MAINPNRVALSWIRSNRIKTGWVAVSTVNVTIGFGGGYETMVFRAKRGGSGIKSYMDLECNRYKSRDAAVSGHRNMVEKWEAKWHGRVPPPASPPRIVVVKRTA